VGGVTVRRLTAACPARAGYHSKPILLVDTGGYWQPCQSLFEQFVAAGFADPSAMRLYELVPDVAEAVRRLRAAAPTGTA